jgi:hypothetical protein
MGPVRAVSGGGGTIINAASCSQTDVNAVINGPTHTAVSGDTIDIPACSGGVTWSSGITISAVAIQIVGAGAGSTVLIDGLNDGSTPLFNFANVPVTSYLARVSGMSISPAGSVTNGYSPISANGVCSTSTCPNFRADHITFTGYAEASTGTQAAWMIRTDNLFGVIDHNTLTDSTDSGTELLCNISHSAYLGVGDYGDNSWAQPDNYGSAGQMYIEDNTLTGISSILDCDAAPVNGSTGGCRATMRFNTLSGSSITNIAENHGTDTGNRNRDSRQFELYGNVASCNGFCGSGSGSRGGTWIQFGNTFQGTGAWNALGNLNTFRVFAGFSPWGYCGGLGGYDQNDGTVYASGIITGLSGSGTPYANLVVTDSTKTWTSSQWVVSGDPYSVCDMTLNIAGVGHPCWEISSSGTNSVTSSSSLYGNDTWHGPPTLSLGDSYQILRSQYCIDQSGRGQGGYISGATPSPTGYPSQALDPIYEFADTLAGGTTMYNQTVTPDTAKSIANRDYYTGNLNAIQSSPTSPFNGSSGTGWGTLANRPTTCTPHVGYWATDQGSWNTSGNGFGQGELFVCTATNTWTAYYTPYQYPYPY